MELIAFVIVGFVALLGLDALAIAFGHDSREAFDEDGRDYSRLDARAGI
jgi:hypothetical protein